MKWVHLILFQQNDEESINARDVYAQTYLNLPKMIDDPKILFLDEVDFWVSMQVKIADHLYEADKF